ncbi:uncharacterized protein VICG_00960 [Vittaforma corneae ATCC 50505]|uniref:Cyclic nucleotide-binding domain-containing protein n=1 Tax=Vittaforma corneae (strain ATCC 50505) TaxID=993615 RepID=L2GM25_VITCO|nr:uncharacterized protein VICG_00960 [Vittaforma corneae ATCC 50505]ELA41943.1 hypothetical protein VICG_00960 [Vittaforma corneae ATCC 50505]
MDSEKARERLKDHAKLFGYQLKTEQEDEIVILYELNNEFYTDDAFSLHIENYMSRQADFQDTVWKEHRRPSVFAKRVSTEIFDIPTYKKTPELTRFLVSQLGASIPFCLLDEEQKCSLVNTMHPLYVEAGVVLIREGDVGAEMYIVEEGEFEVIIGSDLVNRMYSGAVFGELALLHGIPRTATVRAVKKSRVWSAEQTSFTSIRIRDQVYKKSLAREVILEDPFFRESLEDPGNVERILSSASCKFMPASTQFELQDDEVVIVLKPAKIKDTEARDVQPKDLIHTSFRCLTNLECYIVKTKDITE